MSSRQTKGEKTRNQIMQTAKSMMVANGFSATSMRDIAEATGISPASIYNHFKGKDELFECLIKDSLPIEELAGEITADYGENPVDFIRGVIKRLVKLLLNNEDYIRLSLIDAQERQGKNIKKVMPRMVPLFTGALMKVRKEDHQKILKNIPPEAILRVLVSLVFGYVITEFIAQPSTVLNLPEIDWVDSLVDIFMYGVVNPEAASMR